MPITSEQLQLLSVTSLDEYLKNTPIDQVTQNRPFLKKMLENRKKFGGAKQFIKETLRTTNDSTSSGQSVNPKSISRSAIRFFNLNGRGRTAWILSIVVTMSCSLTALTLCAVRARTLSLNALKRTKSST